jgi:glutaminyl-peptide cyclotransferase
MHFLHRLAWMSILCLFAACDTGQATARFEQRGESQQPNHYPAPLRITSYTFEVINTYPHDPEAFTQGLVYHQGALYESTGLNGQSSIRKVDLQTGEVLKKVDVPPQFFGEGLALLHGRAYQLTWQTQHGFIYDLESFKLLNTFKYTGEGWGLTHDGQWLMMSDGTHQIRFLNPDTFEVQRVISVSEGARQINNLNELEYIKGEIYANVWLTDRIARIDPQTGRVLAWINLTGLLPPEDQIRNDAVLNGIAYDEANDRIFVTGKLWPKLFEIRLKQRRNETSR